MKTIIGAAGLAAACLVAAMPAAAAESYVSGGVTIQTMDFDSIGLDKASLNLVTGRFGWKSDSWYGVEGELSLGLNDDEISTTPRITAKMDTVAAVYGVAYLPVGEKVQLLGRVGFSRHVGKIESATLSGDTSDGAIALGLGAVVNINASNALRADVTSYDIDGIDTRSLAISFVRRF